MSEKRRDSKNRVLKTGEYERPNRTYEFRWTDGRGKRHVIYAKTLSDLRETEKALIRDSYDGIRAEAAALTINDLYEKWKVLKKGLKENTFENYKYMYEMFVRDEIGSMKILKLKKTDIRSFYNTLHDVRGLKPQSIVNVQTVLHQVLQLAVDDDYLRHNPADDALVELMRAHGDENSRRQSLTTAEQDLLLDYLNHPGCKYHHWYPLIVTMIYTGMRIGEVAGLRWEDVDFEKDLIDVNHNVVYFCSRQERAKNGNQKWAANTPKTEAGRRKIPMLPIVKEALLMEKAYQEEVGIKCRQVIDGYTNFIFVNQNGDAQHQGTVNKAIRRIIRDCNYDQMDKAGGITDGLVLLPKFSCHSLRHTMATRMNEAGINDRVRMAILGHRDIETTQNIYTDATDDFNKAEMEKLNTSLTKK